MPRPILSTRLSLPARLKSSNNTHNSNPGSTASSRSSSPQPAMTGEQRNGFLGLRVTVIKGRDLAAKDKSGTSDPYLVLSLGDAKEATPAISKTLNPEWNEKLELPIVGPQSALLEVVCWDKDRFGKDYMGQFDVSLEEIFASGQATQEPKWYKLESRLNGKKKSVVTGEVLLHVSLYDSTGGADQPHQMIQKLMTLICGSPSAEDDDDSALGQIESGDTGDNSDSGSRDQEDQSDESDTTPESTPETTDKGRKKSRIARLQRKTKHRAYEFTGTSDVAGVLFIEIVKINDLPPEKNLTRTTFDMDPFVVTSLGKKTYRTRVVRHNLNPIFEEKLVFQVLRHETNYSLNFAVVDRDKLSGNDFVGTANLALENVTCMAPEADPETGLYKLPEPPGSNGLSTTDSKRSRFRLTMSRSSSANSLNRLSKPSLRKASSRSSLNSGTPAVEMPSVTSAPHDTSQSDSLGTPATRVDSGSEVPDLRSFELPLDLKNKERWEAKHNPILHIRAKYMPYKALRQQFWRAMLKQYDADESGMIDKVELTTMLDNLGSTLHESTIDGFFERFAAENNYEQTMSIDQVVICLEDQLERSKEQTLGSMLKGYVQNTVSHIDTVTKSNKEASSLQAPAEASGHTTPRNGDTEKPAVPMLEVTDLGQEEEKGDVLDKDDLADEKGEEHVVKILECPICHQPRLNKKSDADIITHVATCASQDWRQVNNIVMAGFVTSSQAQRKWYSKVITKISYGGYKLGANSANILVQDRMTGQISEERMSVYVRLGIRLLYKGLKSRDMEKKRIRKLLRSLSIKQGKKYDDPASASQIQPFINFHQLDMSEVLLPIEQFKNFNEFFYRALKPEARPCSAPHDPRIITSPADCRTVVFNRMSEAQSIWVKGREFSVERLLGNAYPEDASRYTNGALGIFRLAPQDYHRFHIPVDGTMCEPKLIEGEYYTVNPMAIRSALDVYGENVRVVVPIDSVAHGRVMVVCVGAMMVGSTVITRKAGEHVARAEELGYFKFGGSTILLLFEPSTMKFDEDLVDNSMGALETLVRAGMSIGHTPDQPPFTPDMRKDNPTFAEKQEAKRRIEGSTAPPMAVPTEAPVV